MLTACLAALPAPSPAIAQTAAPDDDRVLRDAQDRLSEVRNKKADAQAQLERLAEERALLEAELTSLGDEFTAATGALAEAEAALATTTSLLSSEEGRLRDAHRDLASRRQLYVRRSRVALQLGAAGYTEALLHADDIGEFTRTVELLGLAREVDRKTITALRDLEADVRGSVVELTALRARHADAQVEATAEQERLAEILAEQEAVRAELAAQEEQGRELVRRLDVEHAAVGRRVEALAVRQRAHPVPTVEGEPAHGIINKRDGVHVWLRYRSPQELYIVSMNRRDGALQIAKKTPGGHQNGGTYHILARRRAGTYPIPFERWQRVAARAVNVETGGVLLQLRVDGTLVLEALDDGTVAGRPLLGPGRVGIRGDNTEFFFDDTVVRHLDAAGGELDHTLLDDFDSYRTGLLTNQHLRAPQSPIWRLTSGSLFVWRGVAWSGKPDYGRPGPRAASSGGNNSAIFRLRTRRSDLRDVEFAFSLRTRGMVDGPYRTS